MTIKITAANERLSNLINKKLGRSHNISEQQDSELVKTQNTAKSQVKTLTNLATPTFKPGDSIQKRAARRQQLKQIRKQQNIESIFNLAIDYCPAVTSENDPDADWVERFIELAEDSSNKAMQRLWAKILAGETIRPGTFSYKSLLTLQQITQQEAQILQLATSLSGQSQLDGFNQILTGYYLKPSLFNFFTLNTKINLNLSKAGLSYPNVLTLIDIDVLYGQEIESAELKRGEEYRLKFNETELLLKAKSDGIVLTYYKFTQTGQALCRLTNMNLNDNLKHQISELFDKHFTVQFVAIPAN